MNRSPIPPLSLEFFDRDPRRVARALLGKLLVRKTTRGSLVGRVVETEAYLGADDAAAHSAAGRTVRNAVIWGPPGHAYVYFIYGNYFCLNVSCLPEGDAGCVLFRALEPLEGMRHMAAARNIVWGGYSCPPDPGKTKKLTSGPGRLCQAFGITRERDNGKNLVSPRSDLQLCDDDYRVRRVIVTPRIGITKSPDAPLRFLIEGNPFVSR